jgi:hypothetical protein
MKGKNRNRLLSCGLFPTLIGFTWGLSPAINWSSLSTYFSFHFHIHPLSSIPSESMHQLVSEHVDQHGLNWEAWTCLWIGKLELVFQKLAEENTKRFDDLEKSLENIASSLNEGFSGGLCKTNEENSQNSIKGLERSFHEVMKNLPKTKGKTSWNNMVHIPSLKSAQFLQSDVPPAFATPPPFHAYPNYDQGHKQVHKTPSPPTGTNINSKTPTESPLAIPAQIRPLHQRSLPCVEFRFCSQRPPP